MASSLLRFRTQMQQINTLSCSVLILALNAVIKNELRYFCILFDCCAVIEDVFQSLVLNQLQ